MASPWQRSAPPGVRQQKHARRSGARLHALSLDVVAATEFEALWSDPPTEEEISVTGNALSARHSEDQLTGYRDRLRSHLGARYPELERMATLLKTTPEVFFVIALARSPADLSPFQRVRRVTSWR